MRQKLTLQGINVVFLLIVLPLMFSTGCANNNDISRKLSAMPASQLKMVLEKNLAASGGLNTWQSVQQLAANALATVLGRDGGRSLVQQKYQLNTSSSVCSVTVISYEAGGTLRETLSDNSSIKVLRQINGSYLASKDTEELLGSAVKLRLLEQAFTGTRGLLQQGFSLHYRGLDRKEGKLFHKIEVSGKLLPGSNIKGKNSDLLVLWFDARTFLLDRLWLRYRLTHKENTIGYLAAKIIDYKTLDITLGVSSRAFLKLPDQIEISYSNSSQQFSGSNIFTLELSDWQSLVKEQH